MPGTSIQVIGSGFLTETSGRIVIETGRLIGLAIHTGPIANPPNTHLVEAGIELGGNALSHRMAILISGTAGGTQTLGWDGDIPLDPTMSIYLRTWATEQVRFTMGILTALDPTPTLEEL